MKRYDDLRGANMRRRQVTVRRYGTSVIIGLLLVPVTGTQSASAECSDTRREEALRADQRNALDHLAGSTELKSEADMAVLAVRGYDFYPHQQTSFRGMGWTVFSFADPAPGRPNVLFYAPDPGRTTVTDPRDGFDFPYRLAGWGYAKDYTPGSVPGNFDPCLASDWFIHERGVHTFEDGGFEMRAVGDEPRGTASGAEAPTETPPDFSHPRLWDIHIWRDDDGVPEATILNPGHKIAGIDPGVGKAFFYAGK